jgi:hypothetical protein
MLMFATDSSCALLRMVKLRLSTARNPKLPER